MFNKEQFIKDASPILEWISEYLDTVENFSVRAKCKYGEIRDTLPADPPATGVNMQEIFSDFKSDILPGITHWQSPKFFAYFPANSSEPSVQAEFLMAALGVQGMKWITSPAATELEERMMEWLRKMLGLGESFTGVIQDTASVSTLCAILAAREKATDYESNMDGLQGKRLRVYCSTEAHSSIEKAVRIAGIGSKNLVKIEVDDNCRIIPSRLEETIKKDLKEGFIPACIIGALGTTGTCAIDPLQELGRISEKYNVWYHIDAAFAGTALILPEFRESVPGIERADSFVFNPHKWMFTNFDCSAFFVKDPQQLQKTFQLVPAYLRTGTDSQTNDFSNWGIQLGRRFRSLKLWFVIRSYGIKGIQDRLRHHLRLAEQFEGWVKEHNDLELVTGRNLVVVCFRYVKEGLDLQATNELNERLMEHINASGKIYISHTFVDGKFTMRLVCAQTHTEEKHIREAMQVIDQSLNTLA